MKKGDFYFRTPFFILEGVIINMPSEILLFSIKITKQKSSSKDELEHRDLTFNHKLHCNHI
jgi:hypothetical protein